MRIVSKLTLPSLLILLLSFPCLAQVSFSGVWEMKLNEDFPERLPGSELGDYGGFPLNAAGRMRASSWSPSLISLPEYQCRVQSSDFVQNFGPIRFWEEVETETQKVIAIHVHHFAFATERTIWMDGRPHPPDYALHTAMGFSTGKWEGDILSVTTTHLSEGWLRNNGIPRSDRAVVNEHFIRHGDQLTWVVYIQDPVYLTEPMIRSRDYVFVVGGSISPYPCESDDITYVEKGKIPHYLPGKNEFLHEYATKHGIPPEQALGGAETMYPEFKNVRSQEPAQQNSAKDAGSEEIHTLPVQGNVYMLVGVGGNITVEIGNDGVLLVDTQNAALAPKILSAVSKLSSRPLRYIVNTNVDADHTAGNAPLRAAGSTVVTGPAPISHGAELIAQANVLKRMSMASDSKSTVPEDALPTSTFEDEKKFYFNGEAIQIIHIPEAHTDGDAIVFFRRSDVIATGDLLTTTDYPVIDLARGGSIQGFIAGLNRILEMVVPLLGQDGGTLIIPGHGRLCQAADLINYREMVAIIRDRIQDMMKGGLTLEQVQAAKPTFDYDPLYGSNPNWTPAMFVEAVYKSLRTEK
jgi:glyoxylase-like metal-dependent hydrolase (beta-lactamase superfamily II)